MLSRFFCPQFSEVSSLWAQVCISLDSSSSELARLLESEPIVLLWAACFTRGRRLVDPCWGCLWGRRASPGCGDGAYFLTSQGSLLPASRPPSVSRGWKEVSDLQYTKGTAPVTCGRRSPAGATRPPVSLAGRKDSLVRRTKNASRSRPPSNLGSPGRGEETLAGPRVLPVWATWGRMLLLVLLNH